MLGTLMKTILPESAVHSLRAARRRMASRGEFKAWGQRGYASPFPNSIKRATLLRHNLPGATWVETGTYHGDTTAFLAPHAKQVFSIEPEPSLFAMASGRFKSTGNVTIIKGTSEDTFPDLLPKLSGNVCFWLDGHYSDGGTFLGAKVSPIEEELAEVSRHLGRLAQVKVLVDDFRLFDTDPGYPARDVLIDWARRSQMSWSVETDIFVATK